MTSRNQLAEEFAEGKKKGRASNLFIEGDTIYSYGYHFPIATVDRKTRTAEFNEDKYSQSTSSQQSAVRRALTNQGQRKNSGRSVENAR